MRTLNWPGPIIDKKSPTYEWAYIKAYLEGESNARTQKVYEEMFSKSCKKGVPFWLVRLAIYYGALNIGYTRLKKEQPSIEKSMLSCTEQLDEKELRNNPKLIHHVRIHDFEDASFGGRELVS